MNFVFKYQALEEGRLVWKQKGFPTQKALLAFLVSNKEAVISQKKAIRKLADACVFAVTSDVRLGTVDKALKVTYSNDKENGLLERTILANTYWWMDSLSDVHIGSKGRDTALFTKSIKEKGPAKIYPIDQHKFDLDGKIGQTLELFEAPISWRALGVGKTGMTEGLFAVAEISKELNERRYNDYLNDRIDQHSVGMQYLEIELAVNDADEWPNEYKIWQKYINEIGNRSKAEGQGYFFAILEAKLFEYSCVIAGANELTPTMGTDKADDAPVQRKKDPAIMHAIKALNKELQG